MKCNTIFLVLGACLFLGGCENKDIGAVKKSTLGDTSFTTGQAFDSRKICASTKWSTTEDRGRTLVEYRCDLSGVEDFNKAQIAQGTSQIHQNSERSKTQLEAELNAAKETLASQQSSTSGAPPGAMPGDGTTRLLEREVAVLEAIQTWLQSDNVDVLATSHPPETDGFMLEAISSYLRNKQLGGDSSATAQAVLTARAKEIQLVASEIASRTADIEKEQQVLKGEGVDALATAKNTVDGEAAQRAALDEQEAANLAKLNANYGSNHVYELFQWVVQGSGAPQLLYVGDEFVAPDGTVKDRKFQDVDGPVKAILKNDMTVYRDYVGQVQFWLQDT